MSMSRRGARGIAPVIRHELRMNWDSGDMFGSAIGAQFDIAFALDAAGETVPAEWGYSPGAGGPITRDDIENDESGEYSGAAVWLELLDVGIIDVDELRAAGDVLSRAVSICHAIGEDY